MEVIGGWRWGGKGETPRNMPLGILDLTEYEQTDLELEVGDKLVCYTDALIESRDADGEMLGEEGLLKIMRLVGDVPSEKLIDGLLKEIGERYPTNLSEDDVTVMLISPNGKRAQYSFFDRLWAQVRFVGRLVKALNPRAGDRRCRI